ncbi:MAG: tetratricopeptide repeat protein [Desulfobulbaceae bacterium]|nr:tetratricopeptide repeat protein [Desulfobulbaceae bacterium]
MSEQQSPFTKLHVEEVTQAKRTLLDELNLPPKVTKFIRDNAKLLQNIFVLLTVLVCAWTFYNYYTQKQKNDSTALLAQAMQASPEIRPERLEEVIDKYSGSGAATWSRMTLIHDQIDKKEYEKAKAGLNELVGSLGKTNPLYSLVLYDLAQVSELTGDLGAALRQYGELREMVGYHVIGYLGEARIYEQQEETTKVRETYEKLKMQKDLDPAVREWVDAKLSLM